MADLTEDQLAQMKAMLQQRYLELREEIRSELERSGNEHYADLAGSGLIPAMTRLPTCWWIWMLRSWTARCTRYARWRLR